jgi:serine protease Do
MRATGRYTTLEPVVAWAHVRRAPDRGPALGGISGGPWVDRQGRVVGVHVAGTPRRGRSYSTAPETLLAAIGEAGVRPSTAAGETVTPANFDTVGNRLRARGTVSQVYCVMTR